MQRHFCKLHLLFAVLALLGFLAPGSAKAQLVTGRISAVAYNDGVQRIYAFAAASDGSLYVNYWDSSNWNWANLGRPGTTAVHSPSAITYFDAAGRQHIYAFVTGGGRLYARYWDGFNWYWGGLGNPGAAVSNPSAITYWDGAVQRIYVFVTGANGHLYIRYWDGFSWGWSDQGYPGTALHNPSAITYWDGAVQGIYTFVTGSNGHLFIDYWDGFNWRLVDEGMPGLSAVHNPSALTYMDWAEQRERIYAFVTVSGHLYTYYWDGFNWHWAYQGYPGTSVSNPSALTYNDGVQRLFVFAAGGNGQLLVNYWDGFSWHWANQGSPGAVVSQPSAISYISDPIDGGPQILHAFVTGSNGVLYDNFWDGSNWSWSNQGLP